MGTRAKIKLTLNLSLSLFDCVAISRFFWTESQKNKRDRIIQIIAKHKHITLLYISIPVIDADLVASLILPKNKHTLSLSLSFSAFSVHLSTITPQPTSSSSAY